MDQAKTLNSEKSSEQNASSDNENVIENLSRIRSREVAASIESKQESMDICEEREDVKDKPEDPHTRSNVKNDQQAVILAEQDEAKLHFSSLKEKRTIMQHGTVSRTNPVKVQSNIKFGRVDKGRKQRIISLRRKALQMMTKNKYLSQTGGCFELSYKSNKLQSEFQFLQDKKSRTVDERKEETRNDSLQRIVTNSSFLNKSQFQLASSNPSQKMSINGNKPSSFAQSASAPIISNVTDTKSQFPKVRSAEEVWKHFLWFLETNKESFDRIMTGGISRENMESSDYANHSLNYATETARESTSQSFEEPVKTKTEYVPTEIPDSLKSEISPPRDANSASVLKIIQQLRMKLLKEMRPFGELLMSIKLDGQKETNMQEKIKFLTDARDLQKKINRYLDVLCDHQKLFHILKNVITSSSLIEDNLSNLTSLTDFPFLETHIRTFFTLFLYQYKSLYSEVPIEKVFKRINSENYALAYRRYRERKAIHESERKMSENDAIKLTACFNISMAECRSKMKQEIPHSQNRSLEDYRNYIEDLRIAINANLNCLEKLLCAGSSVVLPVVKYVRESREKTLLMLYFLDKRRPEVFP
ncbi:hypothetical protein AVEN_253460-1 [Araneus ventricosus]|uniref:Uncharacterized protein n=1 Tax=Araneus ventricosus TaxID=182803 RepID=A0A4Y2SDQ9_ARAVE|nr:hypothetical protein AVEN_253460-1 [Araneus ventricosus]